MIELLYIVVIGTYIIKIYGSMNLKKEINNKNITTFVNLWDFLFHPNSTKLDLYEKTDAYNLLLEIFDYLSDRWIETELYLWNHDDSKRALSFYNFLFDTVSTYKYHIWTLISHIPFWDENQTYNLKKEDIKVNIHWHTHSNEAYEVKTYKNIKYINVCLDYLL